MSNAYESYDPKHLRASLIVVTILAALLCVSLIIRIFDDASEPLPEEGYLQRYEQQQM